MTVFLYCLAGLYVVSIVGMAAVLLFQGWRCRRVEAGRVRADREVELLESWWDFEVTS